MYRNILRPAFAFVCTLLFGACNDAATAPQESAGIPHPAAAKAAVGNKLPSFGVHFVSTNENRCEDRNAKFDSAGNLIGWTKDQLQVAPKFSEQKDEVSAYSILTFDAESGKQVGQFDCILQSGREALPFMKAQLASRRVSPAQLKTLIGSAAFSWDSGYVECDWDGWGLTCDGDGCSRGYAITADVRAKSAGVEGRSAALNDPYGPWHCGPCDVYISENGSSFNCDSGSGTVGGGGGGNPTAPTLQDFIYANGTSPLLGTVTSAQLAASLEGCRTDPQCIAAWAHVGELYRGNASPEALKAALAETLRQIMKYAQVSLDGTVGHATFQTTPGNPGYSLGYIISGSMPELSGSINMGFNWNPPDKMSVNAGWSTNPGLAIMFGLSGSDTPQGFRWTGISIGAGVTTSGGYVPSISLQVPVPPKP